MTLEIFAMVTSGKINTLLVEALQRKGVNALGLSGVDGRLMEAKRKEAIRAVENGKVRILHDDHTGTIQTVNADLLHLLIGAGFTPVIAPLAISPEGVALNVDADRAAAMLAGALRADSLILLTNVPGLMRHFPDESTLIPRLERARLEDSLSFAEGRMKKKVLGASEALEHGVGRVIFADGRVAEPVQRALAGHGTVIAIEDCRLLILIASIYANQQSEIYTQDRMMTWRQHGNSGSRRWNILHGAAFGAATDAVFELVFNTSMTGYQEILTDPSYHGQGVLFTASHIGNVGVNTQDYESCKPQISAVVIRSLSPVVSNWRAEKPLSEWLAEHGVPGISEVDTRYVTRKLREGGTLRAALSTQGTPAETLLERARAWPGLDGVDSVQGVTCAKPYEWTDDAAMSWVQPQDLTPRFQTCRVCTRGCVRLWRQAQHHSPLGCTGRARDGAARHCARRASSRAQSERHRAFQRPRRSAWLALRNRDDAQADRKRRADAGHLSRPPVDRPGAGRAQTEIKVRASRRQSPGQRLARRAGLDHRAEPQLYCGH